MFGVSGRSFDRWLRPDNGVDMSLVTTPEFVGPNTVNPDKTIYRNDWNRLIQYHIVHGPQGHVTISQ